MKRYIKPNTDIHQMSFTLMNPTSVPTDTTQSFDDENDVGAKGSDWNSGSSLWDEEE